MLARSSASHFPHSPAAQSLHAHWVWRSTRFSSKPKSPSPLRRAFRCCICLHRLHCQRCSFAVAPRGVPVSLAIAPARSRSRARQTLNGTHSLGPDRTGQGRAGRQVGRSVSQSVRLSDSRPHDSRRALPSVPAAQRRVLACMRVCERAWIIVEVPDLT